MVTGTTPISMLIPSLVYPKCHHRDPTNMLISKWCGRSAPFGRADARRTDRDGTRADPAGYPSDQRRPLWKWYDRKGLIDQIETLAGAADRGRWALKTMLWLGGSIVAVLTALGQLRSAWTTIWGHN